MANALDQSETLLHRRHVRIRILDVIEIALGQSETPLHRHLSGL